MLYSGKMDRAEEWKKRAGELAIKILDRIEAEIDNPARKPGIKDLVSAFVHLTDKVFEIERYLEKKGKDKEKRQVEDSEEIIRIKEKLKEVELETSEFN